MSLHEKCLELFKLVINTPRNEADMFKSVEELFQAYPIMKLDLDDKFSIEVIWRDIVKKAAPKNAKNALKYDKTELDKMMVVGYQRMLNARNHVKHILTVIKSKRNKKVVLRLVGMLEGFPDAYVTGGAPSPSTRRVIIFYETEGGITAKKRKTTTTSDSGEELSDYHEVDKKRALEDYCSLYPNYMGNIPDSQSPRNNEYTDDCNVLLSSGNKRIKSMEQFDMKDAQEQTSLLFQQNSTISDTDTMILQYPSSSQPSDEAWALLLLSVNDSIVALEKGTDTTTSAH